MISSNAFGIFNWVFAPPDLGSSQGGMFDVRVALEQALRAEQSAESGTRPGPASPSGITGKS